jgi:hypothetical protein
MNQSTNQSEQENKHMTTSSLTPSANLSPQPTKQKPHDIETQAGEKRHQQQQ